MNQHLPLLTNQILEFSSAVVWCSIVNIFLVCQYIHNCTPKYSQNSDHNVCFLTKTGPIWNFWIYGTLRYIYFEPYIAFPYGRNGCGGFLGRLFKWNGNKIPDSRRFCPNKVVQLYSCTLSTILLVWVFKFKIRLNVKRKKINKKYTTCPICTSSDWEQRDF